MRPEELKPHADGALYHDPNTGKGQMLFTAPQVADALESALMVGMLVEFARFNDVGIFEHQTRKNRLREWCAKIKKLRNT